MADSKANDKADQLVSRSTQTAPKLHVIPFPINENYVNNFWPHFHHIYDDGFLPWESTSYQTAALCGLSGAGKTQIALNFVYQHVDIGTHDVLWVHADDETTFVREYTAIGKRLGVPQGLAGDEMLSSVREHIEALGPYVLVIDNADDLTLFGVYQNHLQAGRNLSPFIPLGHGTILWVSQDGHIDGSLVAGGHALHVETLPVEEAFDLFHRVRSWKVFETKENPGRLVADNLGFSSIATTQAATYMRRTGVSIDHFIQKMRTEGGFLELFGRSEYDRHRRPHVSNSILEIWNGSFDKIRRENQLAYKVLAFLALQGMCSTLDEELRKVFALAKSQSEAADFSHRSTLIRGTFEDAKLLDAVAQDDDDYRRACIRLYELGFLTLEETHCSHPCKDKHAKWEVHSLVTQALKHRLSIENKQAVSK